ncbi:hypothetical protein D3C72_1304090 [compost metagenome]
MMRRAAERRCLHRQNREDAGHEVEDQAAEQGEQGGLSKGGQIDRGLGRRFAAGQGAGAGRARQSRAGRCGDFPGAEVGGEDAGDRSRQALGGQAASGGDGQGQAVRAALAGLDGGVVDDAAFEGEEIGPCRRGAGPDLGKRSAGRAQDQLAVRELSAGLDPGGTRGRLDDGLDGRAMARVQRRGAVLNLEVQRQIEVFGHAHLVAADEDVGDDLEPQGLAGASVGGDVDGNRQEDGVGIAVVHQALQALTLGQGPDDLAGLDPGGQGPVQGGGAAGIPLVAPIGVPAGLNLLAYGDDGGRAGRGPGAHRDQFSLDPLGALRPGGRGGGARLEGFVQGGGRSSGRGG